ncbi:MAG: DUF4272 domain-containing protein [Paracoccus sp. (in: a-proteobacteria)]|nr:DUF4272 domain-containing protein [Paracoccus sp. (in: a-proteobacteria)]
MTRKSFLQMLAGLFAPVLAPRSVQAQPLPGPDQLARRDMIAGIAASPRPDEIARKARSEGLLRAQGVRVLDSLPVIAGESRSLRRGDREVAQRLLGCMIAAVKGETDDPELGRSLVAQFGAADYLTPAEAAFILDPAPDPQWRMDMTWRYEGALILVWALGLRDGLPPGGEIADVAEMGALLRDLGSEGLFTQARLRPQADILDMADYYYRLHWAVTDARLNGRAMPPGGDASIVLERARALNWLYGYAGQEWDEVSADT